MPDTVIRPSIKLIKLAYWLAILLAAVVFAYSYVDTAPRGIRAALALPALVFVWAAALHVARRFTKLTVGAERLRYESGILSRSTRTMELAKVQDVRVDQSLGQRVLNIGNLSIETAGETSRMTIANIDGPNQAAEHILNAAHHPAKGDALK
jgi:uncharacterized membrane protein YdbT with pleckstrin-like domain